jgi:hypothetical protein
MSTSRSKDLPVALRTARRQLDRWRSRHRPRTRLPEELWRKAVTLARRHGLNKTASALGLKYYSLKKHMETTAADEPRLREGPPEFLELLPHPMTTPSLECTIELEEPNGTTLRMHVKGVGMADLASFVSALRGPRA